MRLLDFGGARVAVSTDSVPTSGLDAFLDRAEVERAQGAADLSLRITVDASPRLVIDPDQRQAVLTIPERRPLASVDDPTIVIAVVQAAARCVALVRADDYALLHGGAVVTAGGHAVAVLDGSRGQGKTSLALALGLAGGRLLADEFLFADVTRQAVVTRPAPRLPWHIRADMTAHLTSDRLRSPLVFADDLGLGANPGEPVCIEVVLLPDVSLAPGVVVQVPRDVATKLLRAAVNDHRAKLLDPALDHVSLFTSRSQVVARNGATLTGRLGRAVDDVHHRLARLPVYLVGIGEPHDIATTAESVRQVLGAG